jgi:hypothetical protein
VFVKLSIVQAARANNKMNVTQAEQNLENAELMVNVFPFLISNHAQYSIAIHFICSA